MLANLVKLSLVTLALPITALASSHGNLLNRHHDLAKRQPGTVDINRRTDNARMSFYNVETGNAGSCGKFHVNSDFTVAMNQGQMNNDMCFKTISISYGGKTTTATVSDTCPGCPYGGLDLTEGLFSFFAPHSVGIIYGEWHFTDGGDSAPKPVAPTTTKTTKKATPTWTPPSTTWTPPTSTWKPPTSTWTPPTTTKLPKKTSTTWTSTEPTTTKVSTTKASTISTTSTKPVTSTSATSSTLSSSSSVNYSTGAAAGLAVPTGTINTPAGSTENIANMYQAFIRIGGLIAAAGN